MPYRGDYVMGDYRGDPGFLKAIVGVAKGAVKGFGMGGPLGAIAGARAGLPAKTKTKPIGGIPIHPTHDPAIDTFLRRGGRFSPAGKAKLTREHALAAGIHPALAGFRSGRRLNPLNVKALRRAGRRLKGFLKIARRMGALPVNRGKGKKIFSFHRKKTAKR